MKKSFLVEVALFFIFAAGKCFASEMEINTFKESVSVGGLWRCDSVKTGGSFEVGFPLFEKKGGLVIKDFVTLSGYGDDYNGFEFGEFGVGNKLLLGGKIQNETFSVVCYGFVLAEFGFVVMGGKSFFAPPFIFDMIGGGGFEFRYNLKSSFFVEYGGGYSFVFPAGENNFSSGMTSFTLGYRTMIGTW